MEMGRELFLQICNSLVLFCFESPDGNEDNVFQVNYMGVMTLKHVLPSDAEEFELLVLIQDSFEPSLMDVTKVSSHEWQMLA